ncbi:MAG TPA: glutaminase A [Nocardioidaceae bacterium]|nr:glutaminase A [Nocardioidaceae bacterium]
MVDARTSRQIDERLNALYQRHLSLDEATAATYYEPGHGYSKPELAGDERHKFGISIADLDGGLHVAGDHDEHFAVQSISKVFVYCLALADCGSDRVLEQVGVEPSGDAFNSILLDERNRRPYNPMVNAGAIATTGMVKGKDTSEKVERIVEVMRLYAGNESLEVDRETFELEWRAADRNRAIAYLMRSQGSLTGDVEETLAAYLQQCSIMVNSDDLARMGATLANGGVNPVTGVCPLPASRVRDVLSVMFTCGMYDFAGEWAFDVGVPAKSGVSGGILVAVPGKMGLATYSPGLDPYGNSVRGVGVCQEVSRRLGLHVFAGEEEDALLGSSAPAS